MKTRKVENQSRIFTIWVRNSKEKAHSKWQGGGYWRKKYKRVSRINEHGFPDLITKHKGTPSHITEISEHSKQRDNFFRKERRLHKNDIGFPIVTPVASNLRRYVFKILRENYF